MTNRERVRLRILDMLAELRADRRKWFDSDELRDVLGSERLVACIVKIRKAEKAQREELERRGYTCWGKDEPGLWYYREQRETGIRETQAVRSHIETARKQKATMTPEQWAKPNAGGTNYPMRMLSWERQLKSWPASLKRIYEGLSEREKLYLTAPVPNPTRCDEYPAPGVASLGIFYPELSPRQREQIAALEAELARLEKENDT